MGRKREEAKVEGVGHRSDPGRGRGWEEGVALVQFRNLGVFPERGGVWTGDKSRGWGWAAQRWVEHGDRAGVWRRAAGRGACTL